MKKVTEQTGRSAAKLASPAARELAGRGCGLHRKRILATVSQESRLLINWAENGAITIEVRFEVVA